MKELREIWNIMKYLFSHTPRHQQDTIRFSSQAQREGGNYLEEIYEISEIYGIQEIYQVCEKRDFFAWFLVGRHWGSGRAEDHAFCFFKKVRNSQIFIHTKPPHTCFQPFVVLFVLLVYLLLSQWYTDFPIFKSFSLSLVLLREFC